MHINLACDHFLYIFYSESVPPLEGIVSVTIAIFDPPRVNKAKSQLWWINDLMTMSYKYQFRTIISRVMHQVEDLECKRLLIS